MAPPVYTSALIVSSHNGNVTVNVTALTVSYSGFIQNIVQGGGYLTTGGVFIPLGDITSIILS